jgi:hypothetical protein
MPRQIRIRRWREIELAATWASIPTREVTKSRPPSAPSILAGWRARLAIATSGRGSTQFGGEPLPDPAGTMPSGTSPRR